MNRNNTLYRVQTSRDARSFDENSMLGILQHLDKDTLEQLNGNEEKLKDYVMDQQSVKNLEADKEMLIASNKSLAEYNKSMQPKVSQGRELLAIEYERAAKLKEEYDSLMTQIASTAQTQSLDLAHALLQTKAAESEDETDKLSEDFLDKKMDCDEFLDQYIEKRTQTHLLKIKSEKLGEMMMGHVTSALWGASLSAPSANSMPQQSGSSNSPRPPYPMYSGMPPVSS